MTPEWIAILFMVIIIVLALVGWRPGKSRNEYSDVQVIFEEGEWCVYGITPEGERVLIDAFHQQTQALSCAYKVAQKQQTDQQEK